MHEEWKNRVIRIVLVLGYVFFFAVYLFPLAWVGLTAVKPTELIMSSPPVFRFQPILEHFIRLQTEWKFYGRVLNSLIISSGTTFISVGLGIVTAFALSRYNFRGKTFIPIWFLSNRFLPAVAVVLPLFLMFQKFRLVDTYIVVILTNLIPTLPFSIWLLYGFLNDIPRELDDAARVDGCGNLMVLWKILLPIAAPSIAVTAIFAFIFSWNEFFIPLVLTRSRVVPVTVAFAGFKQQFRFDWGGMSAAAMICLVPLFIMVAILHKHVVRGMTLGAVKG